MLPYIAAAAGLVFAGYHTMGPASQLYGSTFLGEAPGSRRLALTFDDGPSDPWTLRLLDVLERHGVRATFFMIGAHIARRPEIARAVADAGHALGNHTYTHPLLTLKPAAALRTELCACSAAIRNATGESARVFRPPYGGRRPAVLREARVQGLLPVMWRVAGRDWATQSPGEIESRIRRRVRGGEIILLHDGSPAAGVADRSGTVEAAERLIRRFQDDGYQFVTVPEMVNR